MLFIGGEASNTALASCDVYDLHGKKTEPEKLGLHIPDLPEPRNGAAIVDTDLYVYLIGGCDDSWG